MKMTMAVIAALLAATPVQACISDPAPVKVFSTEWCGICKEVYAFLDENDIDYAVCDIGENESCAEELVWRTGGIGVPVTYICDEQIVGFDREAYTRALGLE